MLSNCKLYLKFKPQKWLYLQIATSNYGELQRMLMLVSKRLTSMVNHYNRVLWWKLTRDNITIINFTA